MENKTNIQLDLNQINIVLAGLAELPFKISVDIISEIKKQVDEQLSRPTGPLTDKIVN